MNLNPHPNRGARASRRDFPPGDIAAGRLRPFVNTFKCFSMSMISSGSATRDDVDKGGKIIMPPSALHHLTQLNIQYPMLFKVTNAVADGADRQTHCGVLEFTAEEGKIYMPYWMMQNLCLNEGSMARVESATLPNATFVKFQPASVDFIREVTDTKAVMENVLRTFACLTMGDVIGLHVGPKMYELIVLETKPESAVAIIECDVPVDFAPPPDYDEDLKKLDDPGARESSDGGRGATRVIAVNDDYEIEDGEGGKKERVGQPDFDFKIGTLTFLPNVSLAFNSASKASSEQKAFVPFSGDGQTLRGTKK